MPDHAAFLSYAHRYRPWVKVLQQNLETCLKATGRRPWKAFLDETDLGSGASWVGQLQVGLGRAEQLVLVVTPEALASAWVEKEWQSFLAADGAEGRLHLAMLVETPLPPFLAQIQCVDFQPGGEPAYYRAVQRLPPAFSARPVASIRLPFPRAWCPLRRSSPGFHRPCAAG